MESAVTTMVGIKGIAQLNFGSFCKMPLSIGRMIFRVAVTFA